MTCSPSQMATRPAATDGRDRSQLRAEALLERYDASAASVPGAAGADPLATATALMDLFRRTGDAEVFDCLVELAGPALFARARARLRSLGAQFDPHEVLQDAIVNIYRYPDKFVASRPGAFAAWSATIVDNAVRRLLRRRSSRCAVALSPTEVLAQQADRHTPGPALLAQDQEERAATASAFAVVLACYLAAYRTLSERERFVLQMVEVQQVRYAELAARLAIRPEALKMVVFRARKRILDRIGRLLAVRLGAAA